MDKKEFNSLQITEQLSYVNTQLKENKTLRAIADTIGISKSTIRERLGKIGYIYNSDLKQYTEVKEVDKQLIKNNAKVSVMKDMGEISLDKEEGNANNIKHNKLVNSQANSQVYVIPKKLAKSMKKSFNVVMDKDMVFKIDTIAKAKGYSRNELISIMCKLVLGE